MKIVVLDSYTLNPGDLDWTPLQKFGELELHDRTRATDIVKRAQDADIVLTNKTPLTAESLAVLPKLRYIGVLATGYNVVDVKAASARGISVTNVPDYGTRSVAQHVFALLLELTQHVGHHAQTVRDGRWQASADFCYWDRPLIELAGKKLGIVGYGRIGRAVADIGRVFGMEILASSRRAVAGVTTVSLDDLFRQSEVVSLHCPLTPDTNGLINTARLELMKREAFLLNTSRGALIVEQDLADALNSDRIAGAALDVLSVEPPRGDNPLLKAKNCVITPHIAWATQAARSRLMGIAVGNLAAFQSGQPRNLVS